MLGAISNYFRTFNRNDPVDYNCIILSESKILSLVLSVLLENATHLVQPLDVRIFSPAKAEMGKRLQTWRDENRGKQIDKYELIRVILPALEKALGNKSLIKEGFRATGLYVEGKGFDPSQVDFSRMHASEVFAQEETGVTVELPATVPEADVLLPVIPAESTSLTAFDPVSETQLLSTLSSGSTLLSSAQEDSLLITETSDPALSLTSHLNPLITATRDTTIPQAGDITAIASLPLITEADVPVTSASVSVHDSGVSGDQPIQEDADTVVSDNPLSQFTIPLEDRKRR